MEAIKKVVVEMTLEQAEANCKALDFFARISMGQINVLEELFRYEGVKGRDETSETGGRPLKGDELNHIGSLCSSIKRAMGFEPGASFGVGSRAVSPDAHRAYEVLCVLRQAVAQEKSPNGDSVWHQGLRVRYTQDPEPKAVVSAAAQA